MIFANKPFHAHDRDDASQGKRRRCQGERHGCQASGMTRGQACGRASTVYMNLSNTIKVKTDGGRYISMKSIADIARAYVIIQKR